MDTMGTGVLRNTPLPSGQDKEQRQSKEGSLSLLIQDILACLEVCKKECAFYQEHGQRLRRKHLNMRLRLSKEQEDKEAFQKISSIIQREHQRNFWRKLNYVTGKKPEKCHLNSGRRSGRVTNGTYDPGLR
jgi:hypothetical protein